MDQLLEALQPAVALKFRWIPSFVIGAGFCIRTPVFGPYRYVYLELGLMWLVLGGAVRLWKEVPSA